MGLEQKIKVAEMASVIQKIDLDVYKGKIASQRWGSPGGNDVAVIELEKAEKTIQSYKWPGDLQKLVAELHKCLETYRQTLAGFDYTNMKMHETELDEALLALKNNIFERLQQ